MHYDLDEILRVALQAARAGGNVIVRARQDCSLSVRTKEDTSLVTSADVEAERTIISVLTQRFPESAILAEESAPELADQRELLKPLWIVDPIDGTTNFARGHVHVGVSIAFADQGNVLAGVVYLPFLDETFSAVKGRGASLNGQSIKVSGLANVERAIVATGFPACCDHIDVVAQRVKAVLAAADDIRRLGACSVDICWVACGRMDAYFEDVKPWDMAAATLIAHEAGAKVGQYQKHAGNAGFPPDLKAKALLVASPGIYDKLAQLLAAA
jgi:myo-inositol-1(or 4)-monophosphatase